MWDRNIQRSRGHDMMICNEKRDKIDIHGYLVIVMYRNERCT